MDVKAAVQYLLDLDWKQEEVADRLKVSQATVSRWLKGSEPRGKTWIALRNLAEETGFRVGPAPARAKEPPPPPIIQVPLISWVSAGRLVEANAIPLRDAKMLAFSDLGSGEFFALQVQGDSMDRYSPEGSIIVVNRRDRTLVNGRPYVFSIRGETTYKLWNKDLGLPEPHSTNPTHKPISIKKKSDLEVVGRVKRTVLDL